jgi:nucleotide-binding universal stress UspA family protein
MTNTPTDVAVFVNRGMEKAPTRLLVPYLGSSHDRLALELAGKVARNTGAETTVLHVVPTRKRDDSVTLGAKKEVDRVYTDPTTRSLVHFKVIEHDSPVAAVLSESTNSDLVVIGVAEEWGLESQLFGWRSQRIARDCPTSLLIVRKASAPAQPPPTHEPAATPSVAGAG